MFVFTWSVCLKHRSHGFVHRHLHSYIPRVMIRHCFQQSMYYRIRYISNIMYLDYTVGKYHQQNWLTKMLATMQIYMWLVRPIGSPEFSVLALFGVRKYSCGIHTANVWLYSHRTTKSTYFSQVCLKLLLRIKRQPYRLRNKVVSNKTDYMHTC